MLAGIIIAAVLFVLGSQVFLSMLTGSIPLVIHQVGLNIALIPHALVANLWSYSILCVPFFIFTGVLLTRTGISATLSAAVDAWVGHFPGGLGIVTIITCMIFAALNGSTVATAAAVGSVMIEPMAKAGYDKRFAAALCVCGGTLGILIPPSIPMVIYAEITEQSILALFTAGIVPGLLLGGVLIISAIVVSKWKHWGMHPPISWSERWKATIKALPILFLPVIVLGGIYGGIITPTEAAAVSSVYSLFLSAVVYRSLTRSHFKEALLEVTRVTGMVFLILTCALLFTKMLTAQGLGRILLDLVASVSLGKMGFLLVFIIMYLVLGTVMDGMAMLILTTPFMYPIAVSMGINPIHFCIMLVLMLEIGAITPPFAINIFVIAGAAKMRFEDVVRGTFYLYPAMFVALMLVIFVPDISLFLGRLIL